MALERTPGPLRCLWGELRGGSGGPWDDLGAPCGHRGCPWGVLGDPLGSLGGSWELPGGSGRVPRHVLGAQVASQEPLGFPGRAPATSQGALGKVDQVHWGPFWGVLDLQKYVRAQILMVKQGKYYHFHFSLRAVSGRSRGGPGSVFGGRGGPRGGPWSAVGGQGGTQGRPKIIDRFFLGPQGGPKSEQASKRWLLENEVPRK